MVAVNVVVTPYFLILIASLCVPSLAQSGIIEVTRPGMKALDPDVRERLMNELREAQKQHRLGSTGAITGSDTANALDATSHVENRSARLDHTAPSSSTQPAADLAVVFGDEGRGRIALWVGILASAIIALLSWAAWRRRH